MTTQSSNDDARVIFTNDTRTPPVNTDEYGSWYMQCINANNEIATFWGLKIKLSSNIYGFRDNNPTTIQIAIKNHAPLNQRSKGLRVSEGAAVPGELAGSEVRARALRFALELLENLGLRGRNLAIALVESGATPTA